ncbi:MAG: DUF599 family protein [Phenylobacterium sp.]|uniref:DUF599 domain-containing protein n=1 Tax=Phenylobacterium sp. TaxID=1871053 RepID=UPI001A5E4C3B|nr:DUF599 family protein [Phenylobacterium sp.]MBL8554066.1 DUF599 family protein [Phenylobacterium sp.]
MSTLNIAALSLFVFAWIFYEPLLIAFGKRRGGVLNTDLAVIRVAWMENMTSREARLMDGQLLGQTLNSCSFFASSNLILIAAAAGALFGGQQTFASLSALEVVHTSSRLLFELQLALVVACLARGLLDFIWAIRQINYCLAALGATPEPLAEDSRVAYGAVLARLLNPALGSFSAGVRGYYFALAAAAWLFGPWTFMAATLGAVGLLLWRQRWSKAALAIQDFRKLIQR